MESGLLGADFQHVIVEIEIVQALPIRQDSIALHSANRMLDEILEPVLLRWKL